MICLFIYLFLLTKKFDALYEILESRVSEQFTIGERTHKNRMASGVLVKVMELCP